MANDTELTYEELLAIVKTATAYNGGVAQFDVGFLKYVNELPMKAEREGTTITLVCPLHIKKDGATTIMEGLQ